MKGGRPKGERKDTIRASKSPTPLDIAWAAGFIEGEGTFRGEFGNPFKNATVAANQNEAEPLIRLQEIFGGAIKASQDGSTHMWYVCGRRSLGVMMTIYKFMSVRRKNRIRKVLIGRI